MHVSNFHTGRPRFHFDEASDAPASAAAAAAASAAKPAWHAGLDAELVGTAQNKGWDMTDPTKAFAGAAAAYSGAQKLIGAPPEKMLRIPEPSADAAQLDAFWQKLGAVKEAKEIDFTAIKGAGDKPFDEKIAEVLRSTAVTTRAPKDVVLSVAQALQKHMDAEAAAANTIRAGQVAADRAALKTSWGANEDRNMFVANQALEKLAQAIQMPIEKAKAAWDAISKTGGIGATDAVNMLYEMGRRMGEDKFVSNGGPGGGNLPMTREAAIAEIAALKSDKLFADRYFKGEVAAKNQMTALHKIAYGQQAA